MPPAPIRGPRLISPAKLPAHTPAPLAGEWASGDNRLDEAQLFRLPTGAGPEDVVVDPRGRLFAGGDDGTLWCWEPGAGTPTVHARTGGRPLGIEVDPRDGSLVVCDAHRGLLRVTDDGTVTELTGERFVFCNNATVARDGTVYFTDSSDRYPIADWKREMLEHRAHGRLLAYQPGPGTVEVVADGLLFPNGVALTPDESAVLLVETTTAMLLRVPLGGGGPQPLVELPGYPDNMSGVGDGTYWIALASLRVPIAERLRPYPTLRRIAALLPERLQPQPKRYGLVALVDGRGRVLRALHGPAGRYHMITGVRQHGDTLHLGSLVEPAVARVTL